MIKAVIFDMFETLITFTECKPYFSPQIAVDVSMSTSEFQTMWRMSENDRTMGIVTVKEALEDVLKVSNCYSKELVDRICKKRIQCVKETFIHLHTLIIPMLEELKKQGTKIGLITNCYDDEAMIIRESVLYPYFDVVCFSCDEKMQKPDIKIFTKCLDKLGVHAKECLYIGDGGSNELETAQKVGMKAAQAVWYLKDNSLQPAKRMRKFTNLKSPMDVISISNNRK